MFACSKSHERLFTIELRDGIYAWRFFLGQNAESSFKVAQSHLRMAHTSPGILRGNDRKAVPRSL